MPFPQEQVAWLLANRTRILGYFFIPQLLAATLFLSFAYATGRVHAHLLFTGAHTRGKIVGLKPVRFQSRSGAGTSHATIIYEPTVEFTLNDRVVRFQEWKGSESNAGLGWSIPIIYDASNPSLAMIDRGFWNWLPWAPCFAGGLLVGLAAIKGLFIFLFVRSPEPEPSAAR